MNELALIADADRRAREYLSTVDSRPVYPDQDTLTGLARFAEALPEHGAESVQTLALALSEQMHRLVRI